MDDLLDVIDAAVYADAFDCAVTEDELWRYARRPLARAELSARLEADPRLRELLRARDGLHCLSGREALLAARPARRRHARLLQRRARRIARVLQYAPFVRGLLLTGSAAADDAGPGADVDLLVIVAPRRLAVVFTLLAPLSRLVSRRVLCPNQYLSEEHLTQGPRDVYVARELAQAQPLAGRAGDLLAANAWIADLLPNAARGGAAPVRPLPGGRALQRTLELALRGSAGDALERALARLVRRRLATHYRPWTGEPPADVLDAFAGGVELRFHGAPVHRALLDRYERRRRELADRLTKSPSGA